MPEIDGAVKVCHLREVPWYLREVPTSCNSGNLNLPLLPLLSLLQCSGRIQYIHNDIIVIIWLLVDYICYIQIPEYITHDVLEGKHRLLYVSFLAQHLLGQEMVKQAPELKSLMAMSKFSVDQDRSSWTGRQDDTVPGKGRLRGRKCEHRTLLSFGCLKNSSRWWYVALYALGSTYEGSPLRWDLEIFRKQLKRTASTEFPESPFGQGHAEFSVTAFLFAGNDQQWGWNCRTLNLPAVATVMLLHWGTCV